MPTLNLFWGFFLIETSKNNFLVWLGLADFKTQ